MSLNRAMVIGNLGGDPMLRNLPSGQSAVGFSIATDESFTDKQGQKQERGRRRPEAPVTPEPTAVLRLRVAATVRRRVSPAVVTVVLLLRVAATARPRVPR